MLQVVTVQYSPVLQVVTVQASATGCDSTVQSSATGCDSTVQASATGCDRRIQASLTVHNGHAFCILYQTEQCQPNLPCVLYVHCQPILQYWA